MPVNQIWLARHGETAWSLTGQHTGSADIPLTDRGREEAAALGRFLSRRKFDLVLVSPLARARETCRIAGYADIAQVDPNLHEWSYGDIEGLTAAEVRAERPCWSLWAEGPPHGECVEDVARRAQSVIDRVRNVEGDVLLFAHGHVLRILSACWLGLPPRVARQFALNTGSVGVLGHEHGVSAILRWNLPTSE